MLWQTASLSFLLPLSKSRAQFKLALRYCKQHEDMMRADSLANSLSSKDYIKFWKDIRRHNNSKVGKFVMLLMTVSVT